MKSINLKDPTNIGALRARCLRDMRKRMTSAYKQVKALMKSEMERSLSEVTTVNEVVLLPKAHIVNRANYVYEVDPTRLNQVDDLIRAIINEALMGNPQVAYSVNWWLNNYSQQAVYQGYSDSLQTAQNLSPSAIVGAEISTELRAIEMENVINQPFYRRRLENVYSRTFNEMKGFAGANADKLSGILSRAMTSGIGYRDVARQVNAAFGQMAGDGERKGRALTIVRTELNRATTQAYMQNTQDLNRDVFDKGGFEVAVMHISALAFNTRPHHAARHGQVYSVAEQEEWWEINGNRISCQCSVADILRDKKTGKVLQQAIHKKAIEQFEAYKKAA